MALNMRGRQLLLTFKGKVAGRHLGTHASPAVLEPALPELPDMPPCNIEADDYSGPTFSEIRRIRKERLSPAMFAYYKKPVLVHQGRRQWVFDHEGTRYLDLFAGIVSVSVGHCHPKLQKALRDQSDKIWHTSNIYYHPRIHEMADKLADKLPGDLKVVYFVNSGSEANDLAMLMARMHTGNYDIISLRNGYHGMSPYTMGLTALSTWKHRVPVNFGIHQTMNPDVYRGPWGGAACRDSPVQTDRACNCRAGYCMAEDKYVDQFEDVIRHSLPKKGLAAFFAEAIQGAGGAVQYPTGFLKRAFELTRANGGVCISDEVQTGFGRTGEHFWGFEGHGVTPDIVSMAKGIGNGFPMAAVVTTPEIASSISGALHFNTFGGNPLACAVGSTVLDIIEEEGLQENAHHVGTYFLKELAKLRDEFPIVGDVRGKGLMIGVEMVTDQESKEPLDMEHMNDIWEATKDMGILIGKGGLRGNVFRIKPTMCVTKEDIDYGVAVIRKAISDHLHAK